MEENQVEQTAETKEQEPQVQETPTAQTFTQDELNNIVERRLAKERGSMYKKLGVEDLDVAINAVKTRRKQKKSNVFKRVSLKKYLKQEPKSSIKRNRI
jgi:hypothetical protein